MTTYEAMWEPITRGEFYIAMCLLALAYLRIIERLRGIASGIAAPSGVETVKQGSTVGKSATAESGDAQRPPQ